MSRASWSILHLKKRSWYVNNGDFLFFLLCNAGENVMIKKGEPEQMAFMPQYIVCLHEGVEISSDILVLVFLLAPCILERSHWVYLPGEVHVGPSLFSCSVETCTIKVCQDKPTGQLQKVIMETFGNLSDFHGLISDQPEDETLWTFLTCFFWNSPPSIWLAVSLPLFTLSLLPLGHSVFRSVSYESLFCVLMSHFADTSSRLSASAATAHTEFYISCPIRTNHIFCGLVELCERIRRVTSPSGFSQKKTNVV